MSTTTRDSQSVVLPENRTAAQVWESGGARYERISRQIADAIEHCVDRLNPQPGERILDVATGTGWTARRVQERGACVTGIDFGTASIQVAKQLDHSRTIRYQVADAEALPFDGGEFDAVISTFGVMFCSNPSRVASEMARVCKPDGRLALANWATHGGVFDMFQVVSRHRPSSPDEAKSSSPFDWSTKDRLHRWLGNSFEFAMEEAVSHYRERTSADAWEAFSTGYGPIKQLVAKLDAEATSRFRDDFLQLHEKHRTPVGVLVPRPYVIVSGRRNHKVSKDDFRD